MNKDTKEKITQLQNLEQNINNLIAQKQQFQAQNIEVENALSQLDSTDKVFSILGNIMVSSTKVNVKKDLKDKQEIINIRLKTMEKQEDKLRAQAKEIQKEVMKEIK